MTTALAYNKVDLYKILLLDVAGFVFFIAATSNLFPNNVDANLFRAELFFSNYHFNPDHLLRGFFSKFSLPGGDLYMPFFSAYLLAHLGLKFHLLFGKGREDLFVSGNDISLKTYPYVFFVVSMSIYLVALLSRVRYGFS